MFLFGENQRAARDDYRPEVHDSDGLSIQTAHGEWIWRPLVNPQRLLVTSFATASARLRPDAARPRLHQLRGPEARYELPPERVGRAARRLGPGPRRAGADPDARRDQRQHRRLLGAGAGSHAAAPDRRGLPDALADGGPTRRRPLALVAQTRRGRGYVKQPDGQLKFVVDFEGRPLKGLAADAAVDAVVTVGAGAELAERNLFRNNVTGGWRMTVRLKRPDASKPLELRAFLKTPQRTVSETWSYIVPAEGDKP